MSDTLDDVIERLRNWPPERREEAARLLLAMEAQDSSPYRLTEAQAVEVQRRLADPDPDYLSSEEVRDRLAHLRR
jgi:hypothetical protein